MAEALLAPPDGEPLGLWRRQKREEGAVAAAPESLDFPTQQKQKAICGVIFSPCQRGTKQGKAGKGT